MTEQFYKMAAIILLEAAFQINQCVKADYLKLLNHNLSLVLLLNLTWLYGEIIFFMCLSVVTYILELKKK